MYSRLARPFEKVLSVTVAGEHFIVPPVLRLLKHVSPAAVLGGIAEAIVHSLYRVLGRWPRPHVGVEVLKRIEPPFTNGNSAPTVVFVSRDCDVAAASLDLRPGSELRRTGHAMRTSSSTQAFDLQASAALAYTTLQVGTSSSLLLAALTAAKPLMSRLLSTADHSSIRKHGPTTECQSSQVLKAWVCGEYDQLSHDMTFHEKVVCGQSRRTLSRPFRLALFISDLSLICEVRCANHGA